MTNLHLHLYVIYTLDFPRSTKFECKTIHMNRVTINGNQVVSKRIQIITYRVKLVTLGG